ncbi:serine O-acetyltransferase [Leucobacter denitrificans]|uniref:Serine acetyltransferase n=1 Tax=Leucobacter denitrificans TaxID=683042 RepID=A0A7G9S795_9MICO|nr:serine acetyltransferase [Leucobacter denitrificans]QNN63720.1 serine acetyltransferase [Leucobacter denitrificans]
MEKVEMSWTRPLLPAHQRIFTRADLKRFLSEDLRAHGYSRWGFHLRLVRPQLHYQRLLRRTEYWQVQDGIVARVLYVYWRVLLARQSQRLGLSIPPGVFGPGLSVAHYGSIVVNDKARFGANCRLHVNTSIGERHGIAPQGGDDVYVAPGAVLYGDIRIGSGAVIGANAVVRADVPGNVTVAGVPAKVIADRNGT